MRVLALDFDGVISDSAPEAFAVALRTFADLRGDEADPLRERDPQLYAGFLDLMPLGNRAEDYFVALLALENGVRLADQDSYDAYYRDQDPERLRAFHRHFYRVRTAWSEVDPVGWRERMSAYPGVCDWLRRRAGQVELAIATSKDRRSVWRLLESYGIDDLFAEGRVLDKEAGVKKSAHLRHLARTIRVPASEVTFVDDKVNHLHDVAEIGSRCALAAWGYNGERERQQARRAGFLVCELDDVDEQLFS